MRSSEKRTKRAFVRRRCFGVILFSSCEEGSRKGLSECRTCSVVRSSSVEEEDDDAGLKSYALWKEARA